ncbi:IS200/IS605 family transposase [Plebeiibacterium sediminum]|uniref:IS200/IS605 family transposase n=1 Tax=Plebeiibacterium sediminum TaxID=2992112 RepID=A0AAE3M9Y9_9BACT|nr:IS200/IS605 family transposase [Plebeiobacterium sediminum]MCW3789788.1 IS200/IS605 family transposase [Plebeiobacterium sediminum]
MGQSLVQNYIHIVFSTKHREPFIDSNIEKELHDYLGGICNNLNCKVIKVGGYNDHIHILCQLSKKITLIKLMEVLKSHSSMWIKTKGDNYVNFYWQNGYGAFSVTPSDINRIIQYITNQHLHHKSESFQNEYSSILNEYHVEYDEEYLWD